MMLENLREKKGNGQKRRLLACENVDSISDYKEILPQEQAMLETGVSSDYSKVIDDPQEQDLTVKQREIKGFEASHAVKASAFVSDIRRMNVALTSAKRALWVYGECICSDEVRGLGSTDD